MGQRLSCDADWTAGLFVDPAFYYGLLEYHLHGPHVELLPSLIFRREEKLIAIPDLYELLK